MLSTKFQKKVWTLIKKIPRGKISTYKIIAQKIGTDAYRAVGTACAKNPYSPSVPCHRVVNSNGFVGNFSAKGGIKEKIKMLNKEGIKVINGKIDLKKFLFEF